MYASHLDVEGDWDLCNQDQGVAILVARPQLLLAMKLLAGRGRRDAEDIDRLLEECQITSVEAALEIFDHYYPQETVADPAMRQLRAKVA